MLLIAFQPPSPYDLAIMHGDGDWQAVEVEEVFGEDMAWQP